MVAHRSSFAWRPGERDAFATTTWDPKDLEPGGYLDTLRDGGFFPRTPHATWSADVWATANTDWESRFKVSCAPEPIALAEIESFHRDYAKYAMSYLREVVARFELRALRFVMVELATHPKEAVTAIGPFDVAEIAPYVAGMLHLKKQGPDARAWLERHPAAARAGLADVAARGKTTAKKAALAALAIVDGKKSRR